MSADGDDTTPSPYLTAREAAAYLHLNEKTLYAMIQDSGIPATKVTGKIVESILEGPEIRIGIFHLMP